MWTLLATIFAMAIFGLIALSVDQNMANQIQMAVVSKAEQQSALLLGQFAQAAHAYAQTNAAPAGTQITVPTLIAAGNLPNGFPTVDPFGQSPQAVVGTTSATTTPVAAWFAAAPTDLKGLNNTPAVVTGVELRIAQNASAMQSTAAAQYGIAAGAAAPYTALQMPFSPAQIQITSTVPGFSAGFQSAAVVYLQ